MIFTLITTDDKKNMKKIVFLVICWVSVSFVFVNAQSTKLDFSMQLQNTNSHNAVIYPNPISQPLFKVKSNFVITKIEVMNLVGKTIYVNNNTSDTFDDMTVKLPMCNKGVYLVKITFADNSNIIKKLLYR
jgi:hypothetical protein